MQCTHIARKNPALLLPLDDSSPCLLPRWPYHAAPPPFGSTLGGGAWVSFSSLMVLRGFAITKTLICYFRYS
jgi:hypothetical protein